MTRKNLLKTVVVGVCLMAAALLRPALAQPEKALADRVQQLEKELQASQAREKLLEERLQRLERLGGVAGPSAEAPAPALANEYPMGAGLPQTPARDVGAAAGTTGRAEIAQDMRDLEKPFWDQGNARERILGGFDFQGFIDARFIFDENVLFDEKEFFDFRLHEVELDILRKFPHHVFARADIDFHTSDVTLEQGFAAITLPMGDGVTVRMGKFNSPIGTEPQDAPRAIFINPSMVHAMAMPNNFVGAMVEIPFLPTFKLYVIGTNGWDRDSDIKEGKSIVSRVEWTPNPNLKLGVSGGIGPERPNRNTEYRRFVVFDAVFTPHPQLDLTMDATWGSQDNAPNGFLPNGQLLFFEDQWWGGQTTALYRLAPWVDVAGRYEIFRDKEGARVFEKGVRGLVIKDVGTPILVNAFSGAFLVHLVPGTDFNIEYQYNRSAGQDFMGIDGFLNHQENLITFQLESAF